MKILVIGSGGREHAMIWKLAQSASVQKIWCAPGNDGIARETECVPLDLRDPIAAADLAAKIEADLTIVGPELPLVLGIADEFVERDLVLLGPRQTAARLEGSKVFAKEFLQRHGIATAEGYGIFESSLEALMALSSVEMPMVIKADGLCAGKGVLVTNSTAEAAAFIERLMEKREFGDAGTRLLLEEGLVGEELSYIILTDGEHFVRMAPARDHKRAFDNDEGPNTGGMGAYSTDAILPPALENTIIEMIVRPTLEGLRAEGMPYRGFLYFGLMLTAQGPKVLEYNCRLGDPETEAVLLRANFDFAQGCMQAALGDLAGFQAEWSEGASVCVVIASKGYPGDPQTGVAIEGLAEAAKVPGAVIFHAGTRWNRETFRTNGGRVLVVSSKGQDLASARVPAYEAVHRIKIEGAHYRTDIGRVQSHGSGATVAHAAGEMRKC